MNIYDKAYELAKAIKNSAERNSLLEAKQRVENDIKSKEMYNDLLELQDEIQEKQFSGEELDQEEIENWQKKYQIAIMHSDIQALFEAENRFAQMIDDIQKIIYESLEDLSRGN